jgi:hypothetical protein
MFPRPVRYTGSGNRLECQRRGGFFGSLGLLYALVTQHLGFQILDVGGRFRLNRDYLRHDRCGQLWPFTRKFLDTSRACRQLS